MGPASVEEIEAVARMMKIHVEDASVHAGRVREMLEYFGILDRARVESDRIRPRQISLKELRADEARPSGVAVPLHHTRDGYVRAPKM